MSTIAEQIVKSGAYVNNWDTPENWISLSDGSKAPAYLSCRRLISQPHMKLVIKEALAVTAKRYYGQSASSVIGLATAGIVWGDAVAEKLHLPFGYVRGALKGYGLGKLVEGAPPVGTQALLVDDTIFTGESLIAAREALHNEKDIATIGALTIASLYSGGVKKFSDDFGVSTAALVQYEDICKAAKENGLFTDGQYLQMMEYYSEPTQYTFN